MFLHIPRAREQVQMYIHTWIYGQNMLGKKVPAFLKSHQWRPKKCQNNRFRVPIHFATNCFWPFSLARLLCTKAVMVSAETIGYYKCGAWPKFSTHSRRPVAMSSMNFACFLGYIYFATNAAMVSAVRIGCSKCGTWPQSSTHSRPAVAMSSMNFRAYCAGGRIWSRL